MSRYKNNDAMRIVVGASYRLGRNQSWSAALGARFHSENNTHYTDGDPRSQAWTWLGLSVDGWKTLPVGRNTLDLSAGIGYVLPLGEAAYATGNAASAKDDISARYVAPAFAYETAGKLSASLRADWVFAPLKTLLPGLFVKGALLKQMGAAPQSPRLEGTAFYDLSAGAFLRF